jgi:spore coat polysaccharide biosynthesis protein SpsF (cytidylyltransferase family)
MDPYIIRRKAFEVIDEIKEESETEFWPEYIKDQSIFRHRVIKADPDHTRNYRLTLDYSKDLELFEAIYRECYKGQPIPTSRVIEYLDANPAISALNTTIARSWLSEERVNRIAAHLRANRDKLIALRAEIYDRHNG